MEILAVKDLTFSYSGSSYPTLQKLSFEVQAGEFLLLCGETGSGKSTLLRLLKPALAPQGSRTGSISYQGTPLEALSQQEAACEIGFVMQQPEQQIVTDKVWHELAFGPENMGLSQQQIAQRIGEMASYFGIEAWYEKSTHQLSGGQKQLLNLAAVMTMDPKILILDEPTAQLDPIAASNFIATLKKLNRDFGLTVIITEHRTEELLPICDRLLILQNGSISAFGTPQTVLQSLRERPELLFSMPSTVRLYHALNAAGDCPMTVKEARTWLRQHFPNAIRNLPDTLHIPEKEIALELRGVCFRYEKQAPDVLQDLSLCVRKKEILCILGGNGSGKSTALSVIAGLRKPYSGSIRIFGKRQKELQGQALYRSCLSLLPQDVQTAFLKNTVQEELEDAGCRPEELPFSLTHLPEKHPYDLSGGEQQLLALAKVLATNPKLLLLDEPTKGLDSEKKRIIRQTVQQLRDSGMTVIIVTHDLEFAADCADRCALFFKGQILADAPPEVFFSENRFYTTAAARMSRGYYDRIATVDQLARICRKNAEEAEG